MITTTTKFQSAINSPVREIKGKVEYYVDSALSKTFTQSDDLVSFEIQRTANGLFFGSTICQRINIKIRDISGTLSIHTNDYFVPFIGVDVVNEGITTTEYVQYPRFYVTEVNRDEKTNQLSVTAYDLMKQAEKYTINDIELPESYIMSKVLLMISNKLGTTYTYKNMVYSRMGDLEFPLGANFDGTETFREVLGYIADVVQGIFYIDSNNKICLKALKTDESAVYTIDKAKYFTLKSKTNRKLTALCSATDLGDNIIATTSETGTTHYIRNNPFLELREDTATILNNYLVAVAGLTINQFECDYRCNPALELGDKIGLITKDDSIKYSYVFDSVITYNGSLSEKLQWNYDDSGDTDVNANSSNLGEMLKDTYAKVNKAEKTIDIAVKNIDNNTNAISQIHLEIDGINTSVESVEKAITDANDATSESIEELTKKVDASITSEAVDLKIKEKLENGVESIETTTGFKFNKDGLDISKTDSDISTNINENGMRVKENDEDILTADKTGVNAINLTARKYLIIGLHSRFEDYQSDRTACFYVGGGD